MNARYITAPGFGSWLDLLTPASVTASVDAAQQVTAALEAQCKASGGKIVGAQCVFPTGTAVSIPQPEDVLPGATDVKAKVEEAFKKVADTARREGTAGAKAGATQVLIVGALVAVGAWLLLRR